LIVILGLQAAVKHLKDFSNKTRTKKELLTKTKI